MKIDSTILAKAVDILHRGGLVAMPTETVYGLGADARNPMALRKIFQAKGRPIDHPLIVHLADISQLPKWANEISESALLLAKTCWPGPLTLILKKAPDVLDLITGNQDTIGIRIPNHPVAQALLGAFGSGLAAPSANRFGRISPTTADAVREELGGAVDLILEGGACEVGVESTIVDVTGTQPVILRPGIITSIQIETILKKSVLHPQNHSPRVSGSLESHYAPRTKTKVVSSHELPTFLTNLSEDALPIALLTRNPTLIQNKKVYSMMMPVSAKQYAHELYRTLRELDKKQFKQIVIEEVPNDAEWEAVRDRLRRAQS